MMEVKKYRTEVEKLIKSTLNERDSTSNLGSHSGEITPL